MKMKPRGMTDGSFQRLAKVAEDELPGEKAEGKNKKDFDKEQLAKGTKVELEHTDDESLAEEIASDHLAEFPNYYEELEKMENKLKREKKSYTSGPDVKEIVQENPSMFKDTEPQEYDELAPINEEEEGGVTLSSGIPQRDF